MIFKELQIGDFFHCNNGIFIKISPTYTKFSNYLMNAVAIRLPDQQPAGNLWHINPKIIIDKIPNYDII